MKVRDMSLYSVSHICRIRWNCRAEQCGMAHTTSFFIGNQQPFSG